MDERFRWILDESIRLKVVDGGVNVYEAKPDRAGGYRSARLTVAMLGTPAEAKLLINNHFVDVGDDFPRFMGIMDAANDGVEYMGDEHCLHLGVFAQPGNLTEYCGSCNRDIPVELL